LGNYALPSGFSNIHSLSDWRRAFNDFWRSGIGADIQDGINYTFSGQMDIEDECGCHIESLGIGGAANADRRSEMTSQSMIDNVNYVSLINSARSEYGKDATIGMLNGEYAISHRRYYAAYSGAFDGWQGYDIVTEKVNANQGGDDDIDAHGRKVDMRSFSFSQINKFSMAAAVSGFTVDFKWGSYPQKRFNIGTIYVSVPNRVEWQGRGISAGQAADEAAKAANLAADQAGWQFAYPKFDFWGNESPPPYLSPGAEAQFNINFIRLMQSFLQDNIPGARVRFISPTDNVTPRKAIYAP